MSRKLLIVDDNAINRQILINVLSKEYDIIEADNGKTALALMHRNYKMLSAVLLDIIMPEMDGYDVLRCVRENIQLAQIPVIMVTGSEDEDARIRALSLGANDFIQKPFNPDIIKHCLRNTIALRETASILNAIQKDKLTGIYNRETFFEKANEMIRSKPAGYYIMSCFDIDNFKLINDQYGAAEGDRILREIGKAVKLNMESIGGLAGRISADNFAALFPTTEKDTDVLQRIQEKSFVTIEQRSIIFSVGRYYINDLSLAASAIYDRAYIAKLSVKGRYDKHLAYFDETMLQRLVRDQQIVGDMETALNEKQFEVWFQPQYNHVTGTLIGAEALVRWRHPNSGLISPGEFIPLFEQNGFVYELDKYVWRETCRYLRHWIDAKLSPLPVSVNISRYDIFRSDLIKTITGIVEEFQIPIHLLRLEITESAFAKSTKLIVEIVKELIALGFVIEIDDFGCGYSSLNTLKSVPAQVVKLDMRFLDGDDDAQRGGNILESVVRMTKWLGVSLIAEGVETKEQGDFLKSIGCSHVQGYLYARPMPADDYEQHFISAVKDGNLTTLQTTEHFDNNMFWDPKSIDSLIFNSFVGAACIYEKCGNRIELLRATDKFAQMLSPEMTVEKLLHLDLMQYIEPASAVKTLALVDSVAAHKGEAIGEFLFLDLPGCGHETYVRSTMRVIAAADNRYLVYSISENITAQRILERSERKITRQLTAIMDNINCGITAVKMNGDTAEYLLANDKYYELLGYTREQYVKEVGNDPFQMVYKDDRQRITDIAIRNMNSKTQSSSMEYRVQRRDGSVMWLRSFLSTTTFEDEQGLVQLCTYADITAEKHTAQNLLDNLPCGVGICVIDGKDAHMIYLNKRYLSYFQHNTGTQRTASVFDVIHPDDHALLRETMRRSSVRGAEGTCVVRIMDGPDEYISFRLFGIAMESETEQNAIYVTFVPISHEELSFSEMLPVALEKMMESSSDLSFVKDKNLKYICCSRAFAQMVGLKDEKDVFGKTDFDLFDAALATQYSQDDRKLVESGTSIVNIVEALPPKDGKNRYSSTSKYLLYNTRGEVIGIYGVGHDITSTREAESRQAFLINNIPGGVAVYEGDWKSLDSIRLTYYSDGFPHLFGYTRDEYEKLESKALTSLVENEYLPGLISQVESLIKNNTPIDYIFRSLGRDDHTRWINLKALPGGEQQGENKIVYAVLFDVTERQEALERLRMSEEENRLARQHSKNAVCRFDIATRTLRISDHVNAIYEMDTQVIDVPYQQIKDGRISPETADVYRSFYERLIHGENSASAIFQRKSSKGWRWIEAHGSTIFSSDGLPVSAVISFLDVNETYEKDAAYKKWMQSLHQKQPASYSLFRCAVNPKTIFDASEGSLIYAAFEAGPFAFDTLFAQYAAQCVFEEDIPAFTAFLNVDYLTKKFNDGERILLLEYRERLQDRQDCVRWLKLTVDMVEYVHTKEIEAYILFEDIDKQKRQALQTMERAERDALTGVYNRTTIAEKANARILADGPDAKHALLMLDIDGFKLVNDAFGHATGDDTLTKIASLLRSSKQPDELVSRLGGDEFIIFLANIPSKNVAENRAKQICKLCRKAISAEVQISGSVGISVYPDDGKDFASLYQCADNALYHVKGTGCNHYAFYHEDMKTEHLAIEPDSADPSTNRLQEKKRRMLIVDDSRIDFELLAHIFSDDFMIEKAKDGNAALTRLRHYGNAISVVLLDLMMPGMDGFAVLKKMQEIPKMQSIPVIVVSGVDDRETSLRAIREGAFDFVMKPVDADVLRIRVMSAISNAENRKLRIKNSSLELQNDEISRYHTVLEKMGLAVIELDWGKNEFTYSPSVSTILDGAFDNRSLWHILMSDLVADAQTVQDLQQLIYAFADDRARLEESTSVQLKTPAGKPDWFRLHIYKQTNEFGLTDKIIITLHCIENDR